MATETMKEQRTDVISFELPAPHGWKKMFTPRKSGSPQRVEIIFISPTGEEIKSRRHLSQYLKSHPGGPSASEFDWGTGDTPRRSTRISEKSKAVEMPEIEPPRKTRKRSSLTKRPKPKKNDADGEGEAAEHEAGEGNTEGEKDTEMKNVEDDGDNNESKPVDILDEGSEQHSKHKSTEMNMGKMLNEEAADMTDSKADQEKVGFPPAAVEVNREKVQEEMTEIKIGAEQRPQEPKSQHSEGKSTETNMGKMLNEESAKMADGKEHQEKNGYPPATVQEEENREVAQKEMVESKTEAKQLPEEPKNEADREPSENEPGETAKLAEKQVAEAEAPPPSEAASEEAKVTEGASANLGKESETPKAGKEAASNNVKSSENATETTEAQPVKDNGQKLDKSSENNSAAIDEKQEVQNVAG